MAERQYYIGHSYNSVQIANAALTVEKGPHSLCARPVESAT